MLIPQEEDFEADFGLSLRDGGLLFNPDPGFRPPRRTPPWAILDFSLRENGRWLFHPSGSAKPVDDCYKATLHRASREPPETG